MFCRIRFNQLLIWISLFLTGCASHHGNVVPDTGPTMEQIYQQSQTNEGELSLMTIRKAWIPSINTPSATTALTRTDNNEVNALFPQFPNPILAMYVFPHVVGDEQLPVPGYTTQFPLYREAPFAMPAEVPVVQSEE